MNSMVDNYKWKPVYEYKLGFMDEVGLVILCIAGLFCLVLTMVGVSDSNSGMICLGIFGVVLMATFATIKYTSIGRIKRRLREKNVEFFDKKQVPGMLFCKTNKGLIGLYSLEKGRFLFEPKYSQITYNKVYFLLNSTEQQWGVYNIELSQMIIPCEYASITEHKDGNIVASKGRMRYLYSPYGSLMKEWSIVEEISATMMDMLDKKT